MENIRNRIDTWLVSDGDKCDKLLAMPNFKDRTIFIENVSSVHMKKTHMEFNKFMYVGTSTLDLLQKPDE
jgi:hypothetical protein